MNSLRVHGGAPPRCPGAAGGGRSGGGSNKSVTWLGIGSASIPAAISRNFSATRANLARDLFFASPRRMASSLPVRRPAASFAAAARPNNPRNYPVDSPNERLQPP
jgi:hypothetical protein